MSSSVHSNSTIYKHKSLRLKFESTQMMAKVQLVQLTVWRINSFITDLELCHSWFGGWVLKSPTKSLIDCSKEISLRSIRKFWNSCLLLSTISYEKNKCQNKCDLGSNVSGVGGGASTLHDSTDEHFSMLFNMYAYEKLRRIKQICRFHGTSKS